jgi:hypothetical protein
MTRRGIVIILLAIAMFCLLGYFCMMWMLYSSMSSVNNEQREIHCKEQTAQEFEGRIIDINTFDYSDYMRGRFFNLKIKISDSTNTYVDYHYLLKPNQDILEFAEVGQKVIKSPGKDTFTLVDSTGVQRTFKIAECSPTE